MREFEFDVVVYGSNVKVEAAYGSPNEGSMLHAKVVAPSEHLARRKIMEDMLAQHIWVRSITLEATHFGAE